MRSEDLEDKGLKRGSVGALTTTLGPVLGSLAVLHFVVVLIFVRQLMVPEFFRGEVLKHDTPVLEMEE